MTVTYLDVCSKVTRRLSGGGLRGAKTRGKEGHRRLAQCQHLKKKLLALPLGSQKALGVVWTAPPPQRSWKLPTEGTVLLQGIAWRLVVSGAAVLRTATM